MSPNPRPGHIAWPVLNIRQEWVMMLKKCFYKLIEFMPDRCGVQFDYFFHFFRLANLNNPVTFNEKVNWRKFYQRDPRFTLFADKVLVKDEIARRIGEKYVIPHSTGHSWIKP